METPIEYKARILKLMEGKDPVAVQRQTAPELEKLVAGVPAEKLSRRSTPDRWSANEVLAQLAEAEITSTWRYRQMLEHNGCSLPGFDQNLWTRLGSYASRKPEDSLTQFRLLRDANLQMFDQLTPEEWEKHGIHTERGRMTVRELAVQIAAHDINHLTQIKAILE